MGLQPKTTALQQGTLKCIINATQDCKVANDATNKKYRRKIVLFTNVEIYPRPETSLLAFYLKSAIGPSIWDIDG